MASQMRITFGDTYLTTSLANALNLDKIQYGAKAEKYCTEAFPKLDFEGLDLSLYAETSKTWGPKYKTSARLDFDVLDKSALLRVAGLDLAICVEASKTWSPNSKMSVGLDLNVLDKSALLKGKHQLTGYEHVTIEALVTVATNHSLPSPMYTAKLSFTPKVGKK